MLLLRLMLGRVQVYLPWCTAAKWKRAIPCFCLSCDFCLSLFCYVHCVHWFLHSLSLSFSQCLIHRVSHCICATNGQKGSANNKPLAHSVVFHAYLMPLAVPLRWRFFCQKVKYQHFRVLLLFVCFRDRVNAWGKIMLPWIKALRQMVKATNTYRMRMANDMTVNHNLQLNGMKECENEKKVFHLNMFLFLFGLHNTPVSPILNYSASLITKRTFLIQVEMCPIVLSWHAFSRLHFACFYVKNHILFILIPTTFNVW